MIGAERAEAGGAGDGDPAGGVGQDGRDPAGLGVEQLRKPLGKKLDRCVVEEIGAEADFARPSRHRVDEEVFRRGARQGEDEEGERQGGGLCRAEGPGGFSRPLRKRRPGEREERHQRRRRERARASRRDDVLGRAEEEEHHRAEGENRQLVGEPEIEDVFHRARRIGAAPEKESRPVGEDGEDQRAEREQNRPPERRDQPGDEREQGVEGEFDADTPAPRDH